MCNASGGFKKENSSKTQKMDSQVEFSCEVQGLSVHARTTLDLTREETLPRLTAALSEGEGAILFYLCKPYSHLQEYQDIIGDTSDDETIHDIEVQSIDLMNEIEAATLSFKNHTVTTDSENDLVTNAQNEILKVKSNVKSAYNA